MSDLILKRIYAYLIDLVVISIPIYTYLIISFETLLQTAPETLIPINLTLQFLPFLLYFFICELFFSATFGKKIMKLKVTSERNPFISVFIRTICRLIPFDLLTFILFKEELLHDRLSKTKVILIQNI